MCTLKKKMISHKCKCYDSYNSASELLRYILLYPTLANTIHRFYFNNLRLQTDSLCVFQRLALLAERKTFMKSHKEVSDSPQINHWKWPPTYDSKPSPLVTSASIQNSITTVNYSVQAT